MMAFSDPYNAAKKIARVFRLMRWTWHESDKIPGEQSIYNKFRELQGHMKPTCSGSATGRLVVFRTRDTKETIYALEPSSEEEWCDWCELNLDD